MYLNLNEFKLGFSGLPATFGHIELL